MIERDWLGKAPKLDNLNQASIRQIAQEMFELCDANPGREPERWSSEKNPSFKTSSLDWHTKEGHVKWMLTEIPRLLDQGKTAQALGYLAFVQGASWGTRGKDGTLSTEDLAERNKKSGLDFSPA